MAAPTSRGPMWPTFKQRWGTAASSSISRFMGTVGALVGFAVIDPLLFAYTGNWACLVGLALIPPAFYVTAHGFTYDTVVTRVTGLVLSLAACAGPLYVLR